MANKHIGSDFDDFLKDEGIQEEVTAAAIKRVIAWQLAEAMKKRHITKTEMANNTVTPINVVSTACAVRTIASYSMRCKP